MIPIGRWRTGVKRRLPSPALATLAGARRRGRDWLSAQTPGERALAQLLRWTYPAVISPRSATGLSRYEARWSSQNGEDGILLHLLNAVGVGAQPTFIEIGAGDGRECNSANLALNFGWRGLLIDGDANHVAVAQRFYDRRLLSEGDRVRVQQAFVTKENVNEHVSAGLRALCGSAPPRDVELLSIDVDGMDYWLWKALDVVSARIVVIEFNRGLGGERPLTVPYEPGFDRFAADPTGCFYGASLSALTQLADAKGYLLAGCESSGTNAFFVRRDLAPSSVVEVSPRDAFDAFGGDTSPPLLAGYVDV